MLDDVFNRTGPFRELARIQDEMNRLFNSTMSTGTLAVPPVNLWATADEALLTAEVPGMDPAEIRLSVQDDLVLLEGDRKEFRPKEGDEVHRMERNFGPFKRSVRLPFRADAAKVEARFKNGVLSVRFPRHESEKPRKIEIAASA